MIEAVIVMAKRTPIGRMGGLLSTLEPEALLAPLIQHIVAETNLPKELIDDVIIGNVVGPGGNIARVAALEAGLPVSVPGVTVDRQCGSGLEAINIAARLIQSGAGEIYLAGGVESTSRAPWKMAKPQTLMGVPQLYTRAHFTPSSYGDPDMGIAAENVARKYGISREEQDQYALKSHQKAVHAQQSDRFQQEIVPLQVEGQWVNTDECPRANTSLDKLQKLPPIFEERGTVTAGNACPINDGAALLLMMSREKCQQLKLKPILRVVDAQAAGVDPNYLGIGPVPAVQKVLKRQKLTVADLDIVEFNEAFASQVLASLNELQIPQEKVNLGGGALAIGHPYGASGAILMTRLCAEMQNAPYQRGLATLGIGGGIGLATLVEVIE
ncbi:MULTISPECIES: thiolase family protein [Paenibacillus]|uniref:thiolase family protein n=1 Tax=Paenibacillus TaxID=44249 RepID=UPI00096E6D9B|nr:thiolase family protein [Paenibacillus odorifer]MEC0135081.1 thiolase family protein [Paenibacillus odorifer]MEC0219630.1 thiolase family protein [Paenibacillus odorifer]OMD15654.1 acetyl-CoA acetyltransferase [Paenibacillus odorifer]OME14222.1 acetyl-CoA acetyltransferase [Paenibacillus odorifer]OZQ72309.1 acetyl-CoA acetyltransferase [Paenibacillus odorifer]